MIINGEGSPVDEGERLKKDRRKSAGVGNDLINFHPPPQFSDDYIIAPHGKYRKRIRFSEDFRTRTQGQLQPKTGVKRRKVSLTHFPRGFSRRNEEVSLIRQQNMSPGNIDIYRRRSPIHHLRNARYAKRREVRYRTVHSPGYYKNRRDRIFRTKISDNPIGMDDVRRTSNVYDACLKPCQTDALTPGTYMVQVEPETDEDCDIGDGTCTIERRQSTSEKCYYIFERQPYKVKFLNYVPTPFEDFVPPPPALANPALNDVSLRLSMPPFRCIPPDCREVVYCKYFQCTSLGFFPDSRNCRKYFFCDLNSNGFVLYHMLCPKGRIFDPIIRECRLREIMDERDVQRCRVEAAKLRRSEKMRIKKNDCDDLIKYKVHPQINFRNGKLRNVVNYSPNERWKRRRLYRIPGGGSEEWRNMTVHNFRGRNMLHQPDEYNTRHHPKYRRKKTWIINPKPQSVANYSKPFTLPKYCEMLFTMTESSTTTTTTTRTTTTSTTESTSPATTQTTSTSTTTETTLSQLPATTTSTTTTKTTSSPCLHTAAKNETYQSSKKQQYYLGDLESDAYQDDMQDYYDDYYDGDYAQENSREGDYEWLRQGLTEYLDRLKKKKGRKMEDKDKKQPDSYNEQSTPAQQKDLSENQNQKEKEFPKLTDQESDMPPIYDPDRGKRSREKSSTSTEVTDRTLSSISQNLPDFEKMYKEEKTKNLDGYPCKKYARYPDKFDNICYYECGAQPDGNMRIEHKCCPKGEEFSPHYLECIGTEYLKVAHRKRSALKQGKSNKKPIPEPEDNYEDDRDMPNEWLDATRTNKVPNEFKSKTKNTLRIFHLHCRRNSSAAENRERCEDDSLHDRKHNVRSFTVRTKKKEVGEEPIKSDDEEEDEYDDEEDYEEEYEDGPDDGGNEKSTVEMERSSENTMPIESSSVTTVSEPPTTSKVLLDADIRVGREFEDALRNILGKAKEQEKHQKRNDKDSTLIRFSGSKPPERKKRNFLKGIFSKKAKNNLDYPDKEGVVSMLTLINGLPSEYERDALLQKLERRRMMNSHLFRIQQGKRKRKKTDDANTNKNEIVLHNKEY